MSKWSKTGVAGIPACRTHSGENAYNVWMSVITRWVGIIDSTMWEYWDSDMFWFSMPVWWLSWDAVCVSSERECDLDKHCGVLDPDRKKVCTRLLTCNVSSKHTHPSQDLSFISCLICLYFLCVIQWKVERLNFRIWSCHFCISPNWYTSGK